jgi:hypothetical protein
LAKTPRIPLVGRLRARTNNTWDILARRVCLTTSDSNRGPSPGLARGATTDNNDIVSRGGNGASTRNVLDGQISDGDTSGRVSVKITTIVVLLDEDTVFRDAAEGDVIVLDVVDSSGVAGDSLDTDTLDGLGDSGAEERDSVDGVVATSSYGSDGKTVAT